MRLIYSLFFALLLCITCVSAANCVYNVSQTLSGAYACDNVTVESGVTITLDERVNFTFTDFFVIESGAVLDGTGQGYSNDQGPGAGVASGRGGSHGGLGGNSLNGPYGDPFRPSDMGSGGDGAAGGAYLEIIGPGSLVNNGTINLNGSFAFNGAGAGGGFFANVSSVSGSGTISANGGGSAAGQGGGGGRIAILADNAESYDASLISVDAGDGAGDGQIGTGIVFDRDTSNWYIGGGWHFNSSNTASVPEVIEAAGAEIQLDETVSLSLSNFTMDTQSRIIAPGSYGYNLTIVAIDTVSLHNASISKVDATADNLSVTGTIDVTGRGFANDQGPGRGQFSNRGGAHGGDGGINNGVNFYYGSAMLPTQFGSGGDSHGGGGLIRLIANETLLTGLLRADGASGSAGTGAGGTIFINSSILSSNSNLSAVGGAASSFSSGGGGRIAVYTNTAESVNFSRVNVSAGSASSSRGEMGTAVLVDSDSNSFVSSSGFRFQETDFPVEAVFTNLTFVDSLVRFEPSISINATSMIVDNDSSFVAENTQDYEMNISAANNVVLSNFTGSILRVVASDITINGPIDMVGRGFGADSGPGAGVASSRGGSYGGQANPFLGDRYGSAMVPTQRGSGGDSSGGGGYLSLIANSTLSLQNNISVNGANGGSGGGSGGAVFINTSVLNGNGNISANGGTGTGNGGGGRIAIYASNVESLNRQKYSALGATGNGDAEDGTVVLVDTDSNDLYAGSTFRFESSDFPSAANFNNVYLTNSQSEFELNISLNVSNIFMNDLSALTADGTQDYSLDINATGTASINNISGSIIRFDVASIEVNGTISADGRGFGADSGPGAGVASSRGGSYGGIGSNNPNGRYGSALLPTQRGSGGDSSAGGGFISIQSNSFTHNGLLSANGANGGAGGGSGGGIYVNTTSILGNGTYSATGGTGTGKGSGGRIAVYGGGVSSLSEDLFDIAGGLSTNPGTLVLVETGLLVIGNETTLDSNDDVITIANVKADNAVVTIDADINFSPSTSFNLTNGNLVGGSNKAFIRSQSINVSGSDIDLGELDILFGSTFDDRSAIYRASVTDLKVGKLNSASIQWTNTVSSPSNLSQNIILDDNVVVVNSSAVPGLNTSAQVTLRTPFSSQPVPKYDPEDDGTFVDCPPTICTPHSFDPATGIFVFNVTQFTGFSSGFDSQLTIYDSQDPEGGGSTVLQGLPANFFANYTNSTSSEPIVGACNISINNTVTNQPMSFNASGLNLYNYTATINVAGNVSWNVSCTNNAGFANLTALDTIVVTPVNPAVPEFSTIALFAVLGLILGGLVFFRNQELN